MKLYYAKFASSLGAHVILEMLGYVKNTLKIEGIVD